MLENNVFVLYLKYGTDCGGDCYQELWFRGIIYTDDPDK